MIRRTEPSPAPTAYDALLLDLDGTLVADDGHIRPRVLQRVKALHARGVRVVIATGRSVAATRPVLAELGFETPAVVFNGAAVWCPVDERMLVERVLAPRAVRSALDWALAHGVLPLVDRGDHKLAPHPRDPHEEQALRYFQNLEHVEHEALPTERVIRVTVFSASHGDSGSLARSILDTVESPTYVTHFPLRCLADHRASPLLVADVHPPCLGKAEGLRLLEERYGIPAERVVAVGDAPNDVPMLEAAGLGVAMGNAMAEALASADRVIGDNNSDALADLCDELFGTP